MQACKFCKPFLGKAFGQTKVSYVST
ncbi:protein of unknown function [Candidatus Promineifilum breve]|uniref:Uncharacterized protein n=1 Tax=Candidatus Promineifilum breve TaxID=1806508 RepID=A0A160T1G1_9CHLR|nr:protein of unknown function [Candidatus Promineifilum breve]